MIHNESFLPGSIPSRPSLLGRSVRGHSIPPIRNVIKHVSFGTNNFNREPENTKSTVASNRFPKFIHFLRGVVVEVVWYPKNF